MDAMVSELFHNLDMRFPEKVQLFRTFLTGIDSNYKTAVEAAYNDALLTGKYFSSGGDEQTFYVHEILLSPGERKIFFRAEPLGGQAFSTTVCLEKVLVDKRTENIKTYQFNSLATKAMTLWVRFK